MLRPQITEKRKNYIIDYILHQNVFKTVEPTSNIYATWNTFSVRVDSTMVTSETYDPEQPNEMLCHTSIVAS